MGSLPELRRLGAATPSPPQARRARDAPRHSVGATMTMQVRKPSALRLPLNSEHGVSSAPGAAVAGRRRESCTSSVGAASVRRLVRAGAVGRGRTLVTPVAAALRSASIASCARIFGSAALLPLQVLQGAYGLWTPGPPLLASFHASSALAAIIAPALLHMATIRRLMPATYLVFALFFALHLYPKVYILVPAYIAAGACLSPLALTHSALITGLAEGTIRGDNGVNTDAVGIPARRALLRRLSRASRAARDFGLLLAAIILPLVPLPSDSNTDKYQPTVQHYYRNATDCMMEYNNGMTAPCRVQILETNSTQNSILWSDLKSNITLVNATPESWPPTESEEELEVWRESRCGARACPGHDEATYSSFTGINGEKILLAISLCACCILAAVFSSLLPSTNIVAGPAPWRATLAALTEPRLRLAGPLAFFIGLEQGFLYAHLIQWYVACVSENGQPWKALVGVALLRALVACTLSMLLAHGRRRVVVAVGLMWNACLLLALSAWRAARADKQLPPVMAAAWAGCDAVWELVQSTLVEEPWCGGLSAMSLSLRGIGMSLSLLARWKLCARWTLRALMVALPAAALPLLFKPDQ